MVGPGTYSEPCRPSSIEIDVWHGSEYTSEFIALTYILLTFTLLRLLLLLANNKKKRFLICYVSCPKETKLLIRLSVVLKKANKKYSFSVISFAI